MKAKRIVRNRFTKQLSVEAWNALYDSFSNVETDSKTNIFKGKNWRKFRLKVNSSTPATFVSAIAMYLSGHYKSAQAYESKGYVMLEFGEGSKKDNSAGSPHKNCDEMLAYLRNLKKKGRIDDTSNAVEKKTSNGYSVNTDKDIDAMIADSLKESQTEGGDSEISNTTIYIIAAMAFVAVAIIILKQ